MADSTTPSKTEAPAAPVTDVKGKQPDVTDKKTTEDAKGEQPAETDKQPTEDIKGEQSAEDVKGEQPTEDTKGKQPAETDKQPTEDAKGEQPAEDVKGKQPATDVKGEQPAVETDAKEKKPDAKGKQPAEDAKEKQPAEEAKGKQPDTKGKQPATDAKGEQAESDEGSDDETPPAVTDAAAAAGTSASASKKKNKNKKKKKSKTAAMADLAKSEASFKKTLESLPDAEIQKLLSLNPAVSSEIAKEIHASKPGDVDAAATAKAALELFRKMKPQEIMTGMATSGKNVKDMASYKFWKTQPVPQLEAGDSLPGASATTKKLFPEGPIQVVTVDQVPKEPAPLVEGFEWDRIDLEDDKQLQEVFELLSGHFVEDNESMFRFRYSKSILRWAMMSPGWVPEWHIGVRASQSRKLVAFISAIPLELRVRDKVLHASEVNFLVVHKKLRAKRLAPILIKEITRLCNLKGVWQALYTAGVVLPKPVSTARYYHRSLDWKKLYEIGFSPLPSNSKPAYQVRKYALPDRTRTKGLRAMRPGDVDAVHGLLTRYLQRYEMAMQFTKEEIDHWFIDKKMAGDSQVVYTYVVEDGAGAITDMFSFYNLDSSVINHRKHNVIRAAYLFYYATETGLTAKVDAAALKARLNELMSDALILAKKANFDVFNATSIMDNALFLEQQKYGPGDGQLHYYLFNYLANPIRGGVDRNNQLDMDKLSGIGFVMM